MGEAIQVDSIKLDGKIDILKRVTDHIFLYTFLSGQNNI